MPSQFPQPLSLAAVRAVILHAQRLATPPPSEPTLDAIYDLVEQLGCVQIDTLQMVHRSQFLVLWSRLGSYDPVDFDRLIYDPDHRRLYEYWQHAASIIPLVHYRYSKPKMRWYQSIVRKRNHGWLADPENHQVIEAVKARIVEEGGLRAMDFDDPRPERGTWWDWKPAKRALEILYDEGELMIANRVKFQRVYDLAERVLPDWVDTTEPTEEEMHRHRVEQAVRGMGICQPLQAAEYAYLRRTPTRSAIQDLTETGVCIPVEARLADGETHTLLIHRDNLPLVEQAADGALTPAHTTFLSPFDSLVWAKEHVRQVWNFRQALEAYKPAPQREWGYFCLPILHHDRLVGRFDPKLERKTGTLRLKALYLEPGIAPDDALVADVAAALRDFLTFHRATDVVIEKSSPSEFGAKLMQAL